MLIINHLYLDYRQCPGSYQCQKLSEPNTAASKRGGKKKGNVNMAQETMMLAVLVGAADVNDDYKSPDKKISPPTEIGTINNARVELTVVDVNAEVNRKLRAIEAMGLMENGDGGDSDEVGFELDSTMMQ